MWPAVGLAITMVVGSGVLVLPGLVYEAEGAAAVWSWVLAAAVCAPLLVVIASLGARYPTAGGVAGFVRPALGDRVADSAEFLLLAAIPGGAGLALVAGHLVADLVGEKWLVGPFAAVMLVVAGGAALRGAEFTGALVRGLAVTFVVMLLVVAAAGLVAGGDGLGTGDLSGISEGIGGLGLVFFAFVGWELMTFMSEEFVDPARDFPRMIAVSFLVVVGLYLMLAQSVQVALDHDDPRVTTSPVATVAEIALGDGGRVVVTVIGVLIVAANVHSVVLAFSRLVFASARRGRLRHLLAVTSTDGNPKRAVIVTVAAFGACVVPERLGWVSQALLFELAASVFFTGFVLAALAYASESSGWWQRLFGIATCGIAVATLLSFGWLVLYPLVVLGVSMTMHRREAVQA